MLLVVSNLFHRVKRICIQPDVERFQKMSVGCFIKLYSERFLNRYLGCNSISSL